MCTKTFVLVLIFILKVLVVLIPLVIYVLKRLKYIDKFINYFYIAEFVSLIILILLCIFGSDCVRYSTFNGIKINHSIYDNVKYIDEETIAIDYTNINPSKKYKNNLNVDVFYYNINLYPLKEIGIVCDNKAYFQNYGNDIAAFATAVTTVKKEDVNPYDILEYLEKTGLLSCDRQPSFDELVGAVSYLYNVNVMGIGDSDINNYLSKGKVVLGMTKNSNGKYNLSCGNNLIVIYAYSDKNSFYILNPSDKLKDTFCPDNTKGYGSIVKGNQNNAVYSIEELSDYISDYYVVEVN